MNFVDYANKIEGFQNNTLAGVILFSVDHNVMTIESTYVIPAYRGQGIAYELVLAAVNKAKNKGFIIAATCSYAAKVLKKCQNEIELIRK